jgi:hypothetical protein
MLILIHLLLALPAVSHRVGQSLLFAQPAADPGRVDALIVLDGDNRRGRLAAAIEEARRWRGAQVTVLGEDWLVDGLIAEGLSPARLRQEAAPSNTREQMQWVRSHLIANPDLSAALIASRLQMPRVAALADAMAITIALVPSPVDAEPPDRGPRRWIPSYAALRMARDAIYEHTALLYYERKGWIHLTGD